MRTVGLLPMMAHLRSVILIGPLAFAASGGFIAAALAPPPNMVAPAIPERDPTNPLRVHFAISLPPQKHRLSGFGSSYAAAKPCTSFHVWTQADEAGGITSEERASTSDVG